MEFDYFYNPYVDLFSYCMLAKIIVTDERFKNLSSDAKILYSCLLERTSLSFKNKWLDEENRVYIIFTVEEITRIDIRAWFSTITQAKSFSEEQEYMVKIRTGFTILFKMTHLREHLKKKKVSLSWKGI